MILGLRALRIVYSAPSSHAQHVHWAGRLRDAGVDPSKTLGSDFSIAEALPHMPNNPSTPSSFLDLQPFPAIRRRIQNAVTEQSRHARHICYSAARIRTPDVVSGSRTDHSSTPPPVLFPQGDLWRDPGRSGVCARSSSFCSFNPSEAVHTEKETRHVRRKNTISITRHHSGRCDGGRPWS